LDELALRATGAEGVADGRFRSGEVGDERPGKPADAVGAVAVSARSCRGAGSSVVEPEMISDLPDPFVVPKAILACMPEMTVTANGPAVSDVSPDRSYPWASLRAGNVSRARSAAVGPAQRPEPGAAESGLITARRPPTVCLTVSETATPTRSAHVVTEPSGALVCTRATAESSSASRSGGPSLLANSSSPKRIWRLPLTPHWPAAAHPSAGSPLQAIVSGPVTEVVTSRWRWGRCPAADALAATPNAPSASTPQTAAAAFALKPFMWAQIIP